MSRSMSTSGPPCSSTPVKPWSSGRVLTPSQREAKRRKDRITKRAKTEKEKDELKDLRSQIKSLQDLIQAHLGLCAFSPSIDLPLDPSSGSPTLPPLDPLPCFQDGASTTEVLQPPDSPPTPPNSETRTSVRRPVNNLALEKWTPCTLSPPLHEDGSCTILEYTNDVFAKTRQLDIIEICADQRLNHDAIIRGILEGWQTLEGRAYFCPLWKLVGKIDEAVFMHSGVLTRFSMLTMVHTMLLAVVHTDSFSRLPSWYRPRPTQINFPHQVTADYFAWPGFRERLVVSNCETLTNRFFRFFASCFRLSWPYSISDAYEIDPPSGLYSFSNAFLAHIRDIRMWAMGKDFFQYFPELQDDMAAEAPTSAVPLQRGVPAAM